MRRSLEIAVLAAVSAVWLSGCADRTWRPVGSEGTMPNADAIRERIVGDRDSNPGLAVVTDKHKVFLSGWVGSDRDRDRAIRTAERTHGVRAVENRLEVVDMTTEPTTVRDREAIGDQDVRDRERMRHTAMHEAIASQGTGTCSVVSDAAGWFRFRPAGGMGGDNPGGLAAVARGKPLNVRVYHDWDRDRDARMAQTDRMTREEMLTGRERSEVREEVREPDRTITREETHVRGEPPATVRERDRDVVTDGTDDLIYKGVLKHKEAIQISGPSRILVKYDLAGTRGERHAACDGGPIMIP